VLICFERKVLLADYWWLVCSERKVLLAGGSSGPKFVTLLSYEEKNYPFGKKVKD
jgi:hypothetical protein